MAIRDRYTYEVVRREEVEESLFLDGLHLLGFEIVRNYEFLPRNYRIQAQDQAQSMDVQACLAQLVEWDMVLDDPLWGEDKNVTGAQTFESYLPQPIDRRGSNLDPSDTPSPTNPSSILVNSDRYGRHWGVQMQSADDLTVARPWDSFKDINDADNRFSFEGDLTGNGVDYYILDTGIDPDHPEFCEFEYGYRTILASGGDDFYETGEDDQNHGTGMASCGAGRTKGVAIHSRIVWAKGLDGNNSGESSALIDGINAIVADFSGRAAEGRPGVMNNSWSSTSSSAYTAAIDAAVDAGLIVVASAGNGYTGTPEYPAAYNDVLSVAAMDLLRNSADFSNFGSTIDVWSAGVDVLQGWRGGTMGWAGGTSPAGGFTTGILCTMLQGYKRPTGRTDVLAVLQHVRDTADEATASLDVSAAKASTTTRRIVKYPVGAQPEQPRIPGLLNMVCQKRHLLGGSSFCRSVTKMSGVGPARRSPVHPARSTVKRDLFLGTASPTAAGDYTSLRPWLVRNTGFADLADVKADTNLLPRATDITALSDADGTSLAVPNNSDVTYAFEGGRSAQGFMHQSIPLRMVPESNPVHFFDLFTNLDWDDGTLAGWTSSGSGTTEVKQVSGSLNTHTGAYMFEATGGADSAISQIADISSSVSTAKIDAGKMRVFIEGVIGDTVTSVPNDEGRIRLFAVDESDADISALFDSGNRGGAGSIGWNYSVGGEAALPVGTRKLRIQIDAIYIVGTVVNAPVDSLMGWVYEETSQGEQVMDAVRRGKARAHHTHIRRSLNTDTDDQGRVNLYYRDDENQAISSTVPDFKSPHNWTQDWMHDIIPDNCEIIRVAVQYFRRAGTAINYHNFGHGLWVDIGSTAQSLASRVASKTSGGNVEAHSTGKAQAAGIVYREQPA